MDFHFENLPSMCEVETGGQPFALAKYFDPAKIRPLVLPIAIIYSSFFAFSKVYIFSNLPFHLFFVFGAYIVKSFRLPIIDNTSLVAG